jgi:hypothetical protein
LCSDATDVETHGHQIGGFFNGYYEHRCFLPLYVYCGPHLLLAKAAPGTIRQKLLKIGARIITSVRRIKISMPDACPTQGMFFAAWRCLAPP